MGEAAKDGFAGGDFDQAESYVSEQEKDCVGEPWVEGGEVQALRQTVGVDEDVDVEVEEIEGEGGFSEQDQWPDREDGRDGVRTGQTQGEEAEERHQESAVHEEIRHAVSGARVEEDAEQSQSKRGDEEALAWREG